MARNLGVPYTDKKPYYFISYNSEDEKRVAEYVQALARLNVPMWYDKGIKIGSEWEREIAERVDSCEAVIMFLSKNIFLKRDSYVHKEYELAVDFSEKNVYLVMLDEIEKREVPVHFRAWWIDVMKHQCINAYEYYSSDEWARLLVENIGIRHDEDALMNTSAVNDYQGIESRSDDVVEMTTADSGFTFKVNKTDAVGENLENRESPDDTHNGNNISAKKVAPVSEDYNSVLRSLYSSVAGTLMGIVAKYEENKVDVVLVDAGVAKLKVIKIVKDVTDVGLVRAKELVDNAPSILKKSCNKYDAEKIKRIFESAGAKIELK